MMKWFYFIIWNWEVMCDAVSTKIQQYIILSITCKRSWNNDLCNNIKIKFQRWTWVQIFIRRPKWNNQDKS